MIRVCAALLAASTSVFTPAPPTRAAHVDSLAQVDVAPGDGPACDEEYARLPLSHGAGGVSRVYVSREVVDAVVTTYVTHYRATLPTAVAGLTRRPGPATLNADRDRVVGLARVLRLFETGMGDLNFPVYARCLRTRVRTRLERLPPGGTYPLAPAAVARLF